MDNYKFVKFSSIARFTTIYDIKGFKTYLQNCEFYEGHIDILTDDFTDFSNLMVCVPSDEIRLEKGNKILGYMFLCDYHRLSETVDIELIDTIVRGENIALKMIEYFEIKFNKPLRPQIMMRGSNIYWTNIGRNI